MEILTAIIIAVLISEWLFPYVLYETITPDKPAQANIYQVLRVADGDTITIQDSTAEGGKRKLRLNGLDAPETGQPYADKSKALLYEMVSRGVKIQVTGTDKYNRYLAWIYKADGTCINSEMVRLGAAWYYEQFCKNNKTLSEYQREAQRLKLGLWSDPNPVAPWDYRKTDEFKKGWGK